MIDSTGAGGCAAKAEQQIDEWQTAVENQINAAEVGGGWLMLARIGLMRALDRNVERVFNPDRRIIIGEAQAQEGSMKTVLIYLNTSARAARTIPN